MAVVLAIPDTHAPFMHPDAVGFLSEVKSKYKPDKIIHLGDIADFYCASRFRKDSGVPSAGQELESCREQLRPLFKLFPVATACYGNHDRRIIDRAMDAGLPPSVVINVGKIIGAPSGWRWRNDTIIDGVIYEHGDPYSGSAAAVKAANANGQNTVIGHIHAHAGINYTAHRRENMWAFNCGCLIDRSGYGFEYARKMAKPVLGCGVIADGVPMFIPMRLASKDRWRGSL